MEHRYETRKPLAVNVVIQDHDQTPILGQTRNISIGGMFVDTNQTKLPVNTFVNVSLFPMVDKQQKSFCASAFVIHSQDSGAGLMFIDLNGQGIKVLHHLMS